MNFDGNFRQYGTIDVSELRACTERQSEDVWRENEFRQNRFEVHTDTQTIYLLFDNDFRHTDSTRLPRYAEFLSGFQPLIETISRHFEFQGWVVRCILTRLRSGSKINFHSDQGFSLSHAHRFHVPIITNEGVLFTVGDETKNMKSGEIWEINNQRRHSVSNTGSEDRVHLIMDWAEPMTHDELMEYGKDRRKHQFRARIGLPQQYD